MISKKFLASSFIYTFSSMLSTLASFLLLPFYTNSGLLKVADFGLLSLFIGLSLLVQVFTNFSIDIYIGVAYHELKDQPEKLKQKLGFLNAYVLFSGTIIATIFAVSGNLFIQHYIENPNPDSYRYVMMSVLTGVFTAHFKFYNAILINREKPMRYLWSNILNFITTVVFSLVILKMFPLTLEGPIWGRLLSCACIFTWSFIDVTWNYGIVFSKEFIKPTIQFCLPLFVTTVFQWILSYSANFIIKPLLFNKELAVFDLATKCTLLVNFLIDGVSAAMTPRIYGLMKDSNNESNIRELNKFFSAFNFVIILILPLNILIIPLVLPVFIGDPKYLEAFLYFGIICAGLVTRGMMNLYIYPINYYRKTSRLLSINGIAAIVQIILVYLMVKQFKLYGAALTLNIVKIILLGLYAYYCSDLLNQKINRLKMIWLPLIVIFVLSVPELFIRSYGLEMHLIHLGEFSVVFLITLFIYRRELPGFVSWGIKSANLR
ncbi:MAG: hypothetical protein JWO06_3219 [Bacteroidota bacterium]|nr:hypothetical protein [Bacteroidota bacterium]